ncbi:hypothetical protein LCGC14_0403550 [marine sediment metagenome]|uniref:Uncharacterized protein n=1 Tax=marine sediment metagenome TaxID=412755 RepID=A0A0F9TE74_9ZZZZ
MKKRLLIVLGVLGVLGVLSVFAIDFTDFDAPVSEPGISNNDNEFIWYAGNYNDLIVDISEIAFEITADNNDFRISIEEGEVVFEFTDDSFSVVDISALSFGSDAWSVDYNDLYVDPNG